MTVERDAEPSRVHALDEDEEQDENQPPQRDESNKRRRLDAGRFPPGSIIRLAMKNFVTYTEAEFYPGPNMNLVIGPNGSGKSTIVCAICLGLGYRPDVLGRATAVGDYVQHGKDFAEIEIELAQENGQSVVVKRKIKRDKNQSTYYLNGKQDTLAKVQELMASFNIQIDNLCQFLPQDRVASFAQLTPIALLHETQRAVGGDEMVAHWERLCTLRAQERDLQAAALNDTKTLQNLNQKQAAAKIHVERLQKRNEIIARIERLKIKIPIAKYNTAQAENRRLKQERNEAQARKAELQARDEPLKIRADNYKARLQGRERQCEKASESLNRTLAEIKKCENKSVEYEDEAAERDRDILRIKKKVSKRRAELEDLERDIVKLEKTAKKYEQNLERMGEDPTTEIQAQIEELRVEKQKLRPLFNDVLKEIRRLQAEEAEIEENHNACADNLRALNSDWDQRLARLMKDPKDLPTAAVIRWLAKDGHTRFKHKVFPPPIMCVGLKDKAYATIVDSCFRKLDLMTFTCLSREDYELFCRVVIDNSENIFEQRMGVKVVEYSGTKQFKDWVPPVPREQLKSLGFDFWLKDIITGPEEVINTLCHQNQIHATAISRKPFTPAQNEAVANLTAESQWGRVNLIEKYIAGSSAYTFTRSKYGQRNVSTNVTNVTAKNGFFNNTVDPEKKAKLERAIEDLSGKRSRVAAQKKEKESIEDDIRAQEEKLSACHKSLVESKNKWDKAKREVDKAKETVRMNKQKLERKLEEEDTTEQDLAEVERRQADAAHERMENATAMSKYVKEAIKRWEELVLLKMQVLQAKADADQVAAESGNQSQDLIAAQQRFKDLDELYMDSRARAMTCMQTVHRQFEEKGIEEEEATKLLQEAVENPISVEELEETLLQEENSLRINSQNNAVGVIELYEKRAEDIKTIETRIEERQTNIENITNQITAYRDIWEPRLQLMVNRVSKAFSEAFQSIGCAGEVLLSKRAEDKENLPETDDFEKWSIEIKVKFRESEKLQLLTGQRQSGGERSVSTIFYLMALQDMAKAPFRVVDEINQGMDPRNERLVHSRMVDAACREDTSQYFLITPKLLPGLEYHKNMKVLTINNGKFVPSALDVGTYITRARALQESL